MANVIKTVNQLGGQQIVPTFPVTLKVKSGTTASIKPGYLVIKDGSNAGYWKAAPDDTNSDTAICCGIATSESTEATGADGVVTIETAPFMVISIKAKTPASLTSAMPGLAYILDVTTGAYTLDQATSTKGIFRLMSYDNVTDGNCKAVLETRWSQALS